MRTIMFIVLLGTMIFGFAQENRKISTIDFVQIVDDNTEEAVFYYENNWKVLRNTALEKNYIQSFQFMKTPLSEEAPFQLMLITTYVNKEQYNLAEERFAKLIDEIGSLRLMNQKKPNEFRKVLFNKLATHLN